ncbi:hypothetical protein VTO73DRAFT_12265 [Trametes versicolor]
MPSPPALPTPTNEAGLPLPSCASPGDGVAACLGVHADSTFNDHGDRGSDDAGRSAGLERDWDELLAAFPTEVPTTRPFPIPRPRSATISAAIMRDDAQRAAAARSSLASSQHASSLDEDQRTCNTTPAEAQVVFPSIRPGLVTPPRGPAPPVVQTVAATAELVAPQARLATPTVAHLEDTVAAGPVVSTARKGKKRARIDSTSPSPATAARPRPPPPQAATPSRGPRLALMQERPVLAPSGWATPATSCGRLGAVATAEIVAALLPPQADASRLPAPSRAASNRPSTSRPLRTGPTSRNRANDENAPPERPIFDMDIDLRLEYPPEALRRPPPYSMPLQSLDLNRVRFPEAFAHMGPLPENDGADNSDDDLWAQVDGTERPNRGVLSVRDRPPTPHPSLSLATNGTTPARVVSHSAAALAASFTPSQPIPPIPVPAGPTQPPGPIAGTATYHAAMNPGLANLASNLQFTSAPPGGFPPVYLADPDGLFRGLSPARGVALRSEAACFIARIHNLNRMTQQEARQATTAVATIVTQVTGEMNPLVVAPERNGANGTNARQGPDALSFAVLGISVESVARMLRQSAWSSAIGTLHVSPATIAVAPFMFVAGGFAHDHNGSILNSVFGVFSGPDVLPYITQLVQTHPDYRDVSPEEASRAILASLVVRVSTLQNGNLMAAVFCDPPTLTPSRWVEWRARVAALPFTHPLNSTGYARRMAPCAACHGEDHPTHLCPFQDVVGWNAPPPGTTWAQPGFAPAPGAPQPPPPPPPPAGGFASRGRSHSGRRGANPPAFNGHRRDYQGGGDGRASGSGSGTGHGGNSGFGGSSGPAPF